MLKRHAPVISSKQAGFTIVELMVATTVFSVILVVITVGVLYFTRSYYKGVYSSMTQSTARTITDTVTQTVQFGANEPVTYEYQEADYSPNTVNFFCAGGYVFVFDLGEKYEVGAATEGMYMQPTPNSGCTVPLDVTGRRQLLGNRMRVTYVNFSLNGGAYTFDIKVAYGDDDLLDDGGGSGAEIQCKSEAGYEYCAVARLTATAQRRKG